MNIDDISVIDKSILNTLISQSQSKKEESYTPNSWKKFMEALQQAISVRENERVTQSQVDAAVVALELSIKELKERADFSILKVKIQEAQNIFNA